MQVEKVKIKIKAVRTREEKRQLDRFIRELTLEHEAQIREYVL